MSLRARLWLSLVALALFGAFVAFFPGINP